MENIVKKISTLVKERKITIDDAKEMLKELQGQTLQADQDIAIIGMAGKFPQANNLQEFWENLFNSCNCITKFPRYRRKDTDDIVKSYVGTDTIDPDLAYKMGGFLKETDKFDAGFFRISPREAMLMEPAQRLFLESAWEAIEDAGLAGERLIGSNTGVFVGRDHTGENMYKKFIPESDTLAATGSWTGILASRIAYIFDFQGPSVVVDTACSSGLVAVHLACQALKNKECDFALAGGVFVDIIPAAEGGQLGMVESTDGALRSFDKNASGTVWGEGVGALLLKPLKKALADGDPIHAVIRGSAINNDGASNGITAPKAEAQEKVILKAWQNARINPETINYIEAHGTGTVLGDPIEVKGLTSAFAKYTDKKQFCGIGSSKSNIGHGVAASGIASLMKMVLCLKHGYLPPSLNFQEPNPYIDFCNSPLFLNDRLREWQRGETPRRAGISAYGFSGTNCHLVVEEAPEPTVSTDEIQPQILTISARSGDVLQAFVQRYYTWVEEHPEMHLTDFCYTANTGRGHFTHRLALIVQDRDDLLTKLDHLRQSGFMTSVVSGIYYGEHKVVNASKQQRDPGELTESERRELSKEAAQCLIRFKESGEGIQEIAEIYTQGAEINWDELYTIGIRKRLHIPPYPLERARHWIDAKLPEELKAAPAKPTKEISHPLLDRCLVDSIQQEIYITEFSVDRHWVLNEHRVFGNYVVPGTTYLELVREAVKRYYPDWSLELGDIYFMTPLMVAEGEVREVQTILNRKDGLIEFTIASRDIEGEWTIHAQGKVSPCEQLTKMTYDLADLKSSFPEVEEVQPKELREGPIQLGPRWANVRRAYQSEDALMVYMVIQDQYRSDMQEYLIHPSMLDTAINAVSQSLGEGVYLPFHYKSAKLYGPMPERFYSYLRLTDKQMESKEVISAHITLIDESGRVFADFEDYRVKRIRVQDFKSKSNLYYGVKWIEKPLAGSTVELHDQKVLLLKDERGISDQLRKHLENIGCRVYEATYGAAFARISDCQYSISGSEDDYRELLKDLKDEGLNLILHLASLTNVTEIQGIEQLTQIQNRGLKSLYYLTRAIAQVKLKDQLQLVLITEGASSITGEEVVCPHNASFIGLGKIISQEMQNVLVRAIDLQVNGEVDFKNIITECKTMIQSYLVGYRNQLRYVEEIERLKLDPLPKIETEFCKDGVYLITGGLGGIGLEMAKYLASQAEVNLALLNRSPLPDPASWEQILNGGDDERLCQKIQAIRELEAQGATVQTYAVDVASYTEMEQLIEILRSDFGRINGVIHAAGVAGDGFLILKEEAIFDEVIRPKISGTWILDQLTRIDKPDFFVLCSSISSLMAGAGQGDYVAANSYLDSYASYRNQAGYPTLAINWAAWRETGMAVNYNVDTESGVFKGLSTLEAMNAFEEVLATDLNRIIIGELNYKHQLFTQLEHLPILFSSEIKETVLRTRRRVQAASTAETTVKRKDVTLKGRSDGSYSDLEKDLASLWGEILALDEVDIYEDFYALGGDSIIAIRLTNAIKSITDVKVDTSDIFQYQNIADFAAYLSQQMGEVSEEKENVRQVIENVEEARVFPLSKTQQRIWFLQRYNPTMTAYNIPTVFKLRGSVDKELFKKAMITLAERHSALRTVFREHDGMPEQVILPSLDISIEHVDLRQESEPESALEKFVLEENKKVLDLTKPLIKVIIIPTSAEFTHIYLNIHHIITDGWSMGVIMQDLIQIYRGYATGQEILLPPLPIRYEDWLKDQEEWLESPECQTVAEYWLEQMKKPLPVLNLPTDYARPRQQTYVGSNVIEWLDDEETRSLKELVKKQGTTMHMFFLTVYFLFLKRITQDDDIIIGVPIAGRDQQELERMVGVFINLLPIRVDFTELTNIRELLNMVKDKSIGAYRNSRYPFDLLVNRLNPERDLSRSPIFTTLFQFFELSPFAQEGISLYDLSLICREMHGQIEVRFEYNTDLFNEQTIQLFAKYYLQLLKMVSDNLTANLTELQLLSAVDEREFLEKLYANNHNGLQAETLHQLWEAQVAKNPEEIAVVYGDQSLTYREFNQKANQLAHTLRNKGVSPNQLVGIMVERSPEMLVGIYGILKAGGAYVPIAPEYPTERIEFILEDSKINILLTQSKFIDKVQHTAELLDLENESTYDSNDENLAVVNQPDDLAYVIYTSGSTGKPKGVLIEHQSVVNILTNLQEEYPLLEDGTYLLKTTYTFDVSVTELFGWFMGVGRIALLAPGSEKDVQHILEAIDKYQITHLNFVPSMLNVFLDGLQEGHLAQLSSLRYVFVAGEAFTRELADKCQAMLKDIRVENIYGPTEGTIYVTRYSLQDYQGEGSIPIGQPFNNIQALIMNKENRLLPPGVPGELCVAGAGVARGYLNREDLTRDKFVLNPLLQDMSQKTSERMYRTGDLARWLADGNIEFLGRIDHQVKIRGYRIEPGEIENHLLQYSPIKDVVVIDHLDESGNKYLCGYLVAEHKVTIAEVREYLTQRLPDYMIPGHFVQLDEIPLNQSGKVDRKALPIPEGQMATGREYLAPETNIEEKLVDIWKDVLGLQQIGVNDHFFELGGHSLKAMVLIGKIQREFQVEIPLNVIFEQPTIRKIGQFIQHANRSHYVEIELAPEKEVYEASSAQKRIYVLQQFDIENVSYNMPGVLEVEGPLNLEHVQHTFVSLIKRHETLRTSFTTVNDKIVQKVHQEFAFNIELLENTNFAAEQLIQEFIRPFDLSIAPLLRVGVIRLAKDHHILIFDMHHIISDGISMNILISEFAQLYEGRELAPIRLQYKDYAEWQIGQLKSDNIKKQEQYWIQRFSEEIPVLNLPTDYPRPAVQSFEGDREVFTVDEELSADLKQIAKATNSTLYMVLLAGVNILLARYSGQDDIIIGSPIAGRPHPDLQQTIGMFVNTLAMRNYPAGDKSFQGFLQEIKANALEAYNHQDYQFETLVDQLNLRRDISRSPLFDVMFVLQNMESGVLHLKDLELQPYHFKNRTAKFDLTITAREIHNTISLEFEYAERIFRAETMKRLFSHLVNIFKTVVSNPEIKIKEITLLEDAEKEKLLQRFNDTSCQYPLEKTLHQLFAEQVARTPEQVALLFDDQYLTYRQLDIKSDRLARLLRDKGVQPDMIIGIMAERSFEMLIGIIGILKAGGAYLPIDPEYPNERIQYMLADSGCQFLLAQNRFIGSVDFIGEWVDLNVTEVSDKLTEIDKELDYPIINTVNTPDNLAYVIYTSGSTGKPKGVMIEHRAVVNRLLWMQEAYPIDQHDVILQKTTYTFDVSVWELFWWSFAGASLALLAPGAEKEPSAIIEAIYQHKVTVMHFVPSMLNAFLHYLRADFHPEMVASLKQVFCSGEALTSSHVQEFRELIHAEHNTRLINLYGPTEATVDVSYYECLLDENRVTVPIGKPIANMSLFILADDLSLQPIGVPGELYISGVGLARGYLNRRELTTERFINNPYLSGQMMYKTGDLARWLPDGNIEFLGRLDHQVKVRGYRIELGEVEAALLEHPGVQEAVVITRTVSTNQITEQLIAYVVLEDEAINEIRLEDYLKTVLPEYMIPAHFVQLDKIPLTSSGKVNRQALPDVTGSRFTDQNEYIAPQTEAERVLAEIWQQVLGIEHVGIHQNFFNLGGDSILGIQVIARLKEFGVSLTIRELYQYPTIAELARCYHTEAAVSQEETDEITDFGLLSAEDNAKLLDILNKKSK